MYIRDEKREYWISGCQKKYQKNQPTSTLRDGLVQYIERNVTIVLTDTDRTALARRYSTECAVRWQGSAVRLSRQRKSLGVAEDEAALAATPRAVRSEPGAAVHHDRTVVRTGAVGL